MARPERIRLGDLLIQEALITRRAAHEALADQKKSGRKLGRMFVEQRLGHRGADRQGAGAPVARALRRPDAAHRAPRDRRACCPRCRHGGCVHCRWKRHRPRCASAWPTRPTWPPTTRWRGCSSARSNSPWWPRASCSPRIDRSYRHGDEIAGLAQELTDRADHGRRRDRRPARPERRQRRRRAGGAAAQHGVRGSAARRAPATSTSSRRRNRCASASASTACCTCRPRPMPRSPARWRCG